MISTLARKLTGFASAIVGPAVVLGSVVAMNEFSAAPEKEKAKAASVIAVNTAPKPKPKPQYSKPRPQRRQPRRSPPPPALSALSSGLGGIDVGLPGLEDWNLGNMAAGLLGGAGEVVHTDDTVDVAPKPSERTAIRYPPDLRRKGVEGYVALNLLVDVKGAVEQVKVLESKPPGVFDDVAQTGVREWRFRPGQYGGKPVRSWVRQRISFDLR